MRGAGANGRQERDGENNGGEGEAIGIEIKEGRMCAGFGGERFSRRLIKTVKFPGSKYYHDLPP